MKSKEELKHLFENGDIPKQEEFWEWQDSYWHKNENIPADKVDYDFSQKADLVDGKVPSSQLPSYVDDVVEFNSKENLPNPGEKGKIYIVIDDNKQYRWSGSDYIKISSDDDLMTTNTEQDVFGNKYFRTVAGGDYTNNTLQIRSSDGSDPSLTFWKAGVDVGQIRFDGNIFKFTNSNSTAARVINAAGFIKEGYNNGFILLAGGGHVPVSEFAINSDLNTTLALHHQRDPGASITNGSNTRINKTWFDYNWANTGKSGSVINFSGLGGAYSTELFGSYNTPDKIAIRTKQGDNGTWNEPRWLWHNKNFNPDNHIPYTGALENVDLNNKNLHNLNRLNTNSSIKHNGLGLSLINASGSGECSSILVKTGLTTGNMGTFTVKMYHYAHEYFEFNVNNYKYNNSNYAPTITWKAGNSKRIQSIEFLKDSSGNLYVNILCFLAYPRVAITDLMVYGWDDVPFDSSNWSIEFNRATSGLTNEVQTSPTHFLRDEGLDNSFWKIYDDGNFKGLLADKPFSFLTNGGVTAQKIHTAGLLTSDHYTDTAYVPANGAYIKGSILTGLHGNSEQWYDAYNWGNHSTAGYATAVQLDSKVNKTGDTVTGMLNLQSTGMLGNWRGGSIVHNYLAWQKYDGSKDIAYIGSDGGSAIGGGTGDNFGIATADGANLMLQSSGGIIDVKGTISTNAHGTSNEWNTAFFWGNHSTAGYATQSWVYSQDYTTPAFVEESIAKLTVELTDPDYHIQLNNKFVTIIITDNFSNEKIIWEEFFPEQSINVINTGGGNFDLDLQGTTFDRIAERETIEYYVNKDRKLIKKGNYRETAILIS